MLSFCCLLVFKGRSSSSSRLIITDRVPAPLSIRGEQDKLFGKRGKLLNPLTVKTIYHRGEGLQSGYVVEEEEEDPPVKLPAGLLSFCFWNLTFRLAAIFAKGDNNVDDDEQCICNRFPRVLPVAMDARARPNGCCMYIRTGGIYARRPMSVGEHLRFYLNKQNKKRWGEK